MRQTIAYILLAVFIGFVGSISTNFSMYLEILNGGTATEDVTSVPEEHNENSLEQDAKLKTSFYGVHRLSLSDQASGTQYFHHQFELVEGFCIDVPYPPPERA